MTLANTEHAHNYCKQKASQSGSSFYYSFLFLPPKQRQAIIAVYAFCREIDDTVDDCSSSELAAIKLGFWQQELDRVFNGTPQHPVGLALKDVLSNFTLQQQHFTEMLQGMFMDLQYQGYQTFADLKLYCHRVASTVGMLAVEIFGYSDPNSLEYARKLGIALQLVNITRDIGEDARRNRIYLPEDELAKFGIQPTDILNSNCEQHPNFQALMQYQAVRARNFYQQALDILPTCDRPQQLSGLIMANIYFTILTEIENSKFQVLTKRISITPLRKLWVAWKTTKSERKYKSKNRYDNRQQQASNQHN